MVDRMRTSYFEEVVAPTRDIPLLLSKSAIDYVHRSGLSLIDTVRIKGINPSEVVLNLNNVQNSICIGGNLIFNTNDSPSCMVPVIVTRTYDLHLRSSSLQITSPSAFVTIEKDTKIASDRDETTGLYIQKRNDILYISNFFHDHAKIEFQGKVFKMKQDSHKISFDLINQVKEINNRYIHTKVGKNRGKKTKITQANLEKALKTIKRSKLPIQ